MFWKVDGFNFQTRATTVKSGEKKVPTSRDYVKVPLFSKKCPQGAVNFVLWLMYIPPYPEIAVRGFTLQKTSIPELNVGLQVYR